MELKFIPMVDLFITHRKLVKEGKLFKVSQRNGSIRSRYLFLVRDHKYLYDSKKLELINLGICFIIWFMPYINYTCTCIQFSDILILCEVVYISMSDSYKVKTYLELNTVDVSYNFIS